MFQMSMEREDILCPVGGTNETTVVNNTVTQKQMKLSRGRSLPSHPSATSPICCGSLGVKVKLLLV